MNNIPQHIVIVPDGNRRFAKQHKLITALGHQKGAETIETTLTAALDANIPSVTIWGCSVANVTERSKTEVTFLMKLFAEQFRRLQKSKELAKHAVRVRFLGRWEELFPESVKKPMRELMEQTKKHTKRNLTFLMAYSGKDEMREAIKTIADMQQENSSLKIDEKIIVSALWSRDLPDVDLVIRTGGEPHWSAGLMMWRVAEAQLYFTKTLWPDFSKEEFKKALDYYAHTERRHGK